jgi:hypothetical protein
MNDVAEVPIHFRITAGGAEEKWIQADAPPAIGLTMAELIGGAVKDLNMTPPQLQTQSLELRLSAIHAAFLLRPRGSWDGLHIDVRSDVPALRTRSVSASSNSKSRSIRDRRGISST